MNGRCPLVISSVLATSSGITFTVSLIMGSTCGNVMRGDSFPDSSPETFLWRVMVSWSLLRKAGLEAEGMASVDVDPAGFGTVVCDVKGTVCDGEGSVCDAEGSLCDDEGSICDAEGS